MYMEARKADWRLETEDLIQVFRDEMRFDGSWKGDGKEMK